MEEGEEGAVGLGEVAPIPGFGGITLKACGERLGALQGEVNGSRWEQVIAEGGPVAFGLGATRWNWRAELLEGPDYLPVAGLLPAGRAALGIVEDRLEMGFRTFKWKVGVSDWREEQGMLQDLLASLPDGAKLRLDANGGWDRRTAERWLALCADYPMVEFIEQPTSPDDPDLLLGLAGDYPVSLALDEAVCGQEDFERWQGLGWPGVYVIKPVLWGDPASLLQVLRKEEADVVVSSGLETVVGARTVLALAFALGSQLSRALGVGVWPLFMDSRLEGPTAAPFIRQLDVLNLSVEAVEDRFGKVESTGRADT